MEASSNQFGYVSLEAKRAVNFEPRLLAGAVNMAARELAVQPEQFTHTNKTIDFFCCNPNYNNFLVLIQTRLYLSTNSWMSFSSNKRQKCLLEARFA